LAQAGSSIAVLPAEAVVDVYTRFIDAECEELLPLSSQILLSGRAAVANDHGS